MNQDLSYFMLIFECIRNGIVRYMFKIRILFSKINNYLARWKENWKQRKIVRFSKLGIFVFVFLCASVIANLFSFSYILACDEKKLAALQSAYQLRLDTASFALTFIGIILVFGGIFSFLHIKEHSERIARERADEVLNEIVKPGVLLYIEDNLEDIIKARLRFNEQTLSAQDANSVSTSLGEDK